MGRPHSRGEHRHRLRSGGLRNIRPPGNTQGAVPCVHARSTARLVGRSGDAGEAVCTKRLRSLKIPPPKPQGPNRLERRSCSSARPGRCSFSLCWQAFGFGPARPTRSAPPAGDQNGFLWEAGAGVGAYYHGRSDPLDLSGLAASLAVAVEPPDRPRRCHREGPAGEAAEPMRLRGPARRSRGRKKKLDARRGFEPRLTESESVVLPLDDRAVRAAK